MASAGTPLTPATVNESTLPVDNVPAPAASHGLAATPGPEARVSQILVGTNAV